MGATTNCHGFAHLQHLKGYFYPASNFQPNMYHQISNHVGYINFKSIWFWSNSPRSLARFVPLLITVLNTGSVKSQYSITGYVSVEHLVGTWVSLCHILPQNYSTRKTRSHWWNTLLQQWEARPFLNTAAAKSVLKCTAETMGIKVSVAAQ
jgi:hypothetical protein